MKWYKARAAQSAAAEEAGHRMAQQIDAMPTREDEARAQAEEPASGERDPLFRQAAEVCIQNQLGSTSLLQRRMSIGYGRAARIIDQLEQAGILGLANGSKPRDVLVGLDELDGV
jgi:S-DNA-T family DNA segregation ATPase FtsK/SpoIIIE